MSRWLARLFHRLLRLVRASEKAGATEVQEAANCALAALRVGKAVHALHLLGNDAQLSESTGRSIRCALLRLQYLQAASAKALPFLQAVAARIAPRHPYHAHLLRLASQHIAQPPDFIAASP